jgi:AsmA protein
MARHFRRLIPWLLSGIAALMLLAFGALAALWWFIDPNDYRAQIESRASSALDRPVHLSGALRWRLGRQISIVSEGGEIDNVAGFGAEPLARWSRIRFGLAARPLLQKRAVVDRVDIDRLQLRLHRNAAGVVNWAFEGKDEAQESAAQPVTLRIAEIAVHDSAIHYQDAGTGADWRVTGVEASAKLPENLTEPDRRFRAVKLAGRVTGKPLAAEGVAFAMQAAEVRLSPQLLQVPAFTLRWVDAELEGQVTAQLAAPLDVAAKLDLTAPSLRALLASANIVPPPMRDPDTLGQLQLSVQLHHAAGATTLKDLSAELDGTHLQGEVSVPRLKPIALRFNLTADRLELDRYREPADVKKDPLELPLAWLKQLDAKGAVRIQQATIAGAAAKEVRIDVE